MAVVELKGKILAVGPVFTIGEKQTKKQSIYLNVPGYTDQFGDKKGNDETWQLDIIGERIERLKLDPSMELKKAAFKCFLNSNTVAAKEGKPEMYIINAIVSSYEIIP